MQEVAEHEQAVRLPLEHQHDPHRQPERACDGSSGSTVSGTQADTVTLNNLSTAQQYRDTTTLLLLLLDYDDDYYYYYDYYYYDDDDYCYYCYYCYLRWRAGRMRARWRRRASWS